MAIYDDDQCERCGSARASGSNLCVGCLVKERAFLDKEILIHGVTIKMLRKKLELQTGRLEEACHYGFERNQENLTLRSRIQGLLTEIARGINNGKDRVQENR